MYDDEVVNFARLTRITASLWWMKDALVVGCHAPGGLPLRTASDGGRGICLLHLFRPTVFVVMCIIHLKSSALKRRITRFPSKNSISPRHSRAPVLGSKENCLRMVKVKSWMALARYPEESPMVGYIRS